MANTIMIKEYFLLLLVSSILKIIKFKIEEIFMFMNKQLNNKLQNKIRNCFIFFLITMQRYIKF